MMSFKVDSAYCTECSMTAIRNGYGLLCAAVLLIFRFGHENPEKFPYARLGVPHASFQFVFIG